MWRHTTMHVAHVQSKTMIHMEFDFV